MKRGVILARIDTHKKILIKTLSLMEDSDILDGYNEEWPEDLELRAS